MRKESLAAQIDRESAEREARRDMVESPPHYRQGQIECIAAIRAALTDEEYRGYMKGNVIKYVWRERHKGGDESLAKARWYLNTLLSDFDRDFFGTSS